MDSINGTAKEGQDYVKVKEVVEFKENEEEKEVIRIEFVRFETKKNINVCFSRAVDFSRNSRR